MTTVATTPAYPIPNRPCAVRFVLEETNVNYVRVWCTVAPDGSALAKKIAAGRLARALVYEGAGGEGAPWRTTFDKGGAYTLITQEYTKGAGWGGGYYGDPRGAPTETKVGSEYTVSLYVPQRLTQELGTGDDKATLVLFISNATIISTIASVHGEATPAVVNPTSDRAKAAATYASVITALAALVGVAVSTAAGSLGTVLDAMIAKFVLHAESAAFHEIADSQTDLNEDYTGSTSLGGIAAATNKLRRRLALHMMNSRENDSAHPEYQLPGGIDIHVEGAFRFDLANALLSVTADENNPATIYAALGDFWRAYTAHRTAGMHDAADSTNTLATLTGLLLLHKEFMTSLAAISPTVPPGQSSGATRLVAQGGFVET